MFDKYTSFRTNDGPVRQRLIYGSNGLLERGMILLPPASWAALKRLGAASGRTGSQVIESLIALASSVQGGQK
ncbi:hypothetical protein GTP45_01005 [Pseudoduganella sp. FT55W]|uniref:Ribbon-helix-helix domain-containing protein n=1 Tax=Duganella rivi TaxID=2666083 RepID=A0A7X4K9T2_9BURK|nr:hypothetical protein [Duganella rivi]MYM65410.1 hypothetical protein [Duganella rivi]